MTILFWYFKITYFIMIIIYIYNYINIIFIKYNYHFGTQPMLMLFITDKTELTYKYYPLQDV